MNSSSSIEFLDYESPVEDDLFDESPPENKVKNEEKKSSETNIRKRCPFTREEDDQLLHLVQFYGVQNKNIWPIIASHMEGRNVRQCRERYQLFLSKNVKKGEKWTSEEDRILLSKFALYGTHWKKYEQFFVGRTSYSIKNRFNSLMKPKKMITNNHDFRRINRYYKSFLKKQYSAQNYQNDHPNASLKIDSLICFLKVEKDDETTDLLENNVENNDEPTDLIDNDFENDDDFLYYLDL